MTFHEILDFLTAQHSVPGWVIVTGLIAVVAAGYIFLRQAVEK